MMDMVNLMFTTLLANGVEDTNVSTLNMWEAKTTPT